MPCALMRVSSLSVHVQLKVCCIQVLHSEPCCHSILNMEGLRLTMYSLKDCPLGLMFCNEHPSSSSLADPVRR